MYQSILLKISGELFASPTNPLDLKKVRKVAEEIAAGQKRGLKIGVVVGGGNIFRGRQIKKNEIERLTGDYMGMLATVLNGLVLKDMLTSLGCPARLISSLSIAKVVKVSDLGNYKEIIRSKEVLIYVAGTGNPFVTTDTVAVMRALEMGADILFKGTKVAGVYSADPLKNKSSQKYSEISYEDYLRQNLQVMDPVAVALAKNYSLPIYVFKWQKGSLLKVITEQSQGTWIK
jgi:uridylate kinase